MNKRQAKREACFIASQIIERGLVSWEDYNGIDPDSPDGRRVAAALHELAAELHNRGWTSTPANEETQ